MNIKKYSIMFVILPLLTAPAYGATTPKGFTHFRPGEQHFDALKLAHEKKYPAFKDHPLHPTKTLLGLPSTYNGKRIDYNFKIKTKDDYDVVKLEGYEKPTLKGPGLWDDIYNVVWKKTEARNNYDLIKSEYDRTLQSQKTDINTITDKQKTVKSERQIRDAQIKNIRTTLQGSFQPAKNYKKIEHSNKWEENKNDSNPPSVNETKKQPTIDTLVKNQEAITQELNQMLEHEKNGAAALREQKAGQKRAQQTATFLKIKPELNKNNARLGNKIDPKTKTKSKIIDVDRTISIEQAPKTATSNLAYIVENHEKIKDLPTFFKSNAEQCLTNKVIEYHVTVAKENPITPNIRSLMEIYTVNEARSIFEQGYKDTFPAEVGGTSYEGVKQKLKNTLEEIRETTKTPEQRKKIDTFLGHSDAKAVYLDAKAMVERNKGRSAIIAGVIVIALGLILGELLGDL